MSRHLPTYWTWSAMKQRCTNPNVSNYRHYGGRGIAVCDRWNTYRHFLEDMGERPAGTTIDRIENEKGYEPGNCRWATRTEQNRNQRPRRRDGEAHPRARLTEADVRIIRSIDVKVTSQRAIARLFGIELVTVAKIRQRKLWKNVA